MKAKWTIIDTIIVVAVAAVAVAACIMFAPNDVGEQTDKRVEFTVMLQDKEKGLADAMKAGDKVTLSLTEKDGGIIKDVKAESAKIMVYDSINGEYRNEINAEKEDIYVTVEAECSVNDIAITTGGTTIKVGQEIPVRGKGYASTGFVIEIND